MTITRQGLVDHFDSAGATARDGGGDVQWLTAGKGSVHGEMFPLLHTDQPNPAELLAGPMVPNCWCCKAARLASRWRTTARLS